MGKGAQSTYEVAQGPRDDIMIVALHRLVATSASFVVEEYLGVLFNHKTTTVQEGQIPYLT